MKHSFFIHFVNKEISISQYNDGNWVVLKNRGEELQVYHEGKFWQWFLEKIEYQQEKLSFVIVTDNKDFIIPDSSSILLNDLNPMLQDEVFHGNLSRKSQGYFILCFPQRECLDVQAVISEPKKEHAEQHLKEKTDLDVASFFRTQTEHYKNG